MKGYVDVFALPVPKKNLAAYRRMAAVFGKAVAKAGALEYREFLGEDLKHDGRIAEFPSTIKLKAGEVLVFSVVEYRTKAHRNRVNKAIMNDPAMQKMMKMKPIFDMKRMYYGGFSTFVKM